MRNDVIDKMERNLRSKVMILKFRDESLKKYDRAFKERRELQDDEKDVIIVSAGGVIIMNEERDHWRGLTCIVG